MGAYETVQSILLINGIPPVGVSPNLMQENNIGSEIVPYFGHTGLLGIVWVVGAHGAIVPQQRLRIRISDSPLHPAGDCRGR